LVVWAKFIGQLILRACRAAHAPEADHLAKLKAAGRIRHIGPTKAGRREVLE
jgi:hypothetical protein